MLIEQIAQKLETEPQTLERENLRLYVERKIRIIESELLRLAHKYGVQNVTELDEMIRQGKYHEEAFEDYFEFDNLEDERDTLLSVYDNFPDTDWKHISTYPFHFHNGAQDAVKAPSFSQDVIQGFRDFMDFVEVKMVGESSRCL